MISKHCLLTWAANKSKVILFVSTFVLSSLLLTSCAQTTKNMQPERFFDGLPLQLAKAIQDNRLEEVRRLAKEVELNKFYNENMTPLIWSMLAKQPQALQTLLEAGADPNLKDNTDSQPVAFAVTISDDNPYLKSLLQHKGDPNSVKRGEPALHIAFDSEFYKNVDLLLAAHGNIDIRDDHDNTILIKAGYQNKFAEAIQLIRKGASIRAVSRSGGGIALEVQENDPQPGSENYKAQAELKKLLVERGVKFPIPDPSAEVYNSLLNQWHQTPEGQKWQQKLQQIADDPMGFGAVWKQADEASFAAFKAWMAANNIPEPVRSKPKFIDPNE